MIPPFFGVAVHESLGSLVRPYSPHSIIGRWRFEEKRSQEVLGGRWVDAGVVFGAAECYEVIRSLFTCLGFSCCYLRVQARRC
jgi:hypothetical protein